MTHPVNAAFAELVTASFDKQNAMHLIRATLPVVEPGRTEIYLPHWEGIEQQHGRPQKLDLNRPQLSVVIMARETATHP